MQLLSCNNTEFKTRWLLWNDGKILRTIYDTYKPIYGSQIHSNTPWAELAEKHVDMFKSIYSGHVEHLKYLNKLDLIMRKILRRAELKLTCK